MQQKDQKLLRGKGLRMIIYREIVEDGKECYVCQIGDAKVGTMNVIKVSHIHMSPDVFEMVLDDMVPEGSTM